MSNPRKSLKTRIEILQSQIDRCDKPNMFGVSVVEQISEWTKLINKAKRQMAAL